MNNADFVHLHVHSEYSSFDGLSQLNNLVRKARMMGFPAIALTDHGNIGGLIKFIQECERVKTKKGEDYGAPPIKPILGVEAYVSKNRHARSLEEQPRARKGNHHMVLLARNWAGYQNLCTLCNRGWVEGFYHSPRIDLELLSQYSEGLICTSACLASFINANLLHGRYEQAKKSCMVLKDIFGENFFLEVMFHGINAERMVIPDIFKLSAELNIPVICTNDCHYLEKDQALSQEVLMAMSSRKCILDPKRVHHPYSEFYLKSAQDMAAVWGSRPETLMNTVALAERVDIGDIKKNLFGGGTRLPKFEVPAEFCKPGDPPFRNSFRYLKYLAFEGMKRHGWENSKEHKISLEKELKDTEVAFTANKYDFATYFLIVWDIMNFSRQNNILAGSGRGSGYASVLLRCLGITYGVDPIKYGLLWERFLGFDDKRFMKLEDFGLKLKENEIQVNISEDDESEDENRDLENDLGGIDRY